MQIDEMDTHGLEVLKRAAYMPDDSKKWQLGIRTSATGTFSVSGLQNGVKTTCFLVTDVPSAIPPSAFTNRNTILFRNHSSANIVFIGDSNVTATRTAGDNTGGFEVDPNSTFVVDIKATALSTLYAVCETGKTALCKTMEFA